MKYHNIYLCICCNHGRAGVFLGSMGVQLAMSNDYIGYRGHPLLHENLPNHVNSKRRNNATAVTQVWVNSMATSFRISRLKLESKQHRPKMAWWFQVGEIFISKKYQDGKVDMKWPSMKYESSWKIRSSEFIRFSVSQSLPWMSPKMERVGLKHHLVKPWREIRNQTISLWWEIARERFIATQVF